MMDHDAERQHLEQSDRHLAEGAERIAKQEATLAELDRDGHNTTVAAQLLETFKAAQEAGAKHRRTLLRMLSDPEDRATTPG